MVWQFLHTVRRVKLEVRPLFLPQLVRLAALLQPGLDTHCWTDSAWETFCHNTTRAINKFDILVTRYVWKLEMFRNFQKLC